MMILLVGKCGDTFNISLYDLHVEIQCMPFVEASPPLGMENMVATQAAWASFVVERPHRRPWQRVTCQVYRKSTMTMKDLLTLMRTSSHSGFPVLEDPGEDGASGARMIGFRLGNTIVTVILRTLRGGRFKPDSSRDFTTTSTPKGCFFQISHSDSLVAAFPGGGADAKIDMGPFIDRSTLTVQAGFPMSKVYTLFRSLGLRHLVVVDKLGRPAGIITRKELMCAFDRDLM